MQHHFGGALDELLGRPDGLRGIVGFDGTADAVEVLTDGSGIGKASQGTFPKRHDSAADDPPSLEHLVAVALDEVVGRMGVLAVDALSRHLEDAHCSGDLGRV
jgi:hypothetical protein